MRAKRLPLGFKKTKHNKVLKRLMIVALSLFVVFSQLSVTPLMGKASAEGTLNSDSGFHLSLSSFKVDGKSVSLIDTDINQNGTVDLTYHWSADDSVAIADGAAYTFSIPSQIDVGDGFSTDVFDSANNATVGTFTVGSDGTASIQFNGYYADHPNLKNRAGDLAINVSFSQSLKTGTVTQTIPFLSGTSYTLSFKPNTSIPDVSKNGSTDRDFNPSKITWQMDVNTRYQTISGAKVTDTLPAGVNFDKSNVKIYPLTVKLDGSKNDPEDEAVAALDSNKYTVSDPDPDGQFVITFTDPAITQPYRIVYETAIQDSKKSGSPTFKNEVTLGGTVDGSPISESINKTVTAQYAPFMTKSANNSYDPKTQTITWTINYNFNNSTVASPVLHDTVTGDSGYVDGSLTVKQVTPTNASGGYKDAVDVTSAADVTNVSSDKKTFDITLNNGQPTSDAYVITYKTQAADPDHVEQSDVSNVVTSNGKTSKTVTVKVHNVGITKSGSIDPTSNTINWTIDLNELGKTLSDQTDSTKGPTLTDTFGAGVTGFDPSSVVIKSKTGGDSLLADTDYTVIKNTNGFTINFHQAISTIEYLLTYATKYDPDNDVSSYNNSYELTYSDGSSKTETGGISIDPSDAEQYNGYKTGKYDAAAKTFTWDAVINFNSTAMGKATVTDTLVQNPDGNGGYNLVTTGEDGKPLIKVYKFNYNANVHSNTFSESSKGDLVDPADYGVTPATNAQGVTGFILTFKNAINGPYVIEYQSQPIGVAYSNGQYKNDVVLKDADITDDEGTSFSKTVTIPHSLDYTVKDGKMSDDKNTVNWIVEINKAQSDLGTGVSLKDQLSINQTYDHDSFKLYSAVVDSETGDLTKGGQIPANDYSLSFTPTADDVGESFELKFTSGEDINKAYILTYDQNIVRSKGLTNISNNAFVEGTGYTSTPYSEPVNVRIVSGSATGSGEDVGYVSVGDYVWFDKDRNGVQDDDEDGIPGVVLKVKRSDGEAIIMPDGSSQTSLEQTTDSSGYYQFKNLPALPGGQHYMVSIDGNNQSTKNALDGKVPTTEHQGDSAKDSSTDTAESGDLKNDGDSDQTLDFGFKVPSVSVGDYVWKDTNRDGIQQDGEDGINGVKLNLVVVDGSGATVSTDVKTIDGESVEPQVTSEHDGKKGYYHFADLPLLPDGEYYQTVIDKNDSVTVEALKNLIPTKNNATAKDKDSSEWLSTATALNNDGDDDPTLDFGFVEKSVSVGDYVWKDTNRDGIQQNGEDGINGVRLSVSVVDADGQVVKSKFTDVFGNEVGTQTTAKNETTGKDGYYLFPNLPALPSDQYYQVTINQNQSASALANLIPTLAGQGNDRKKDSSTWSATSEALTENGDDDPTLDFGFVQKSVSVGDYVWKDTNRDGIQQDGESGINDVQVHLTLVDANGEHPVTDVFGYSVQPQKTGTKDGNKGYYQFVNLPALLLGQLYRVTVDGDADSSKTALSNLIPTLAGQGGKTQDSSSNFADSISLPDDQDNDPTLDFGYIEKSVSVGDYIWLDKNKNGIQDNNESGIENVVVNVTGPDGKPVIDVFGKEVKAAKTDSKGYYEFDDLPALPEGKHYTVTIDQNASKDALTNLIPTKEKVGGDSAKDSSSWKSESGNLIENGDSDTTLDFGFIQKSVSVGDYVWLDMNKDGIQNDNEKGIEGVTVTIQGPNGQAVKDNDGKEITVTKTDKGGHYEFTNLPSLPAGQHYTVRIDRDASESALTNLAPTKENGTSNKDKDSSAWTSESSNLINDGDKDLSLDFGFIEKSVSVGDYIWLDKDRNGVQNKSESGIPGVVIVITGPDGKPVTDLSGKVVKPVKTDSKGHYEFINLPSLPEGKHYMVSIDREASKGVLKGLIPAKENGTNDKSKDSSTWKAESGNLINDGDKDFTLDFGFAEETVSLVLKGGKPGAIYNVVNEDGRIIARGVMADEEGNVNFKGLANGKYHLVLIRGVEAEAQTTQKPKTKAKAKETKELPITGDTKDIVTMATGAILLVGGGFLAIFSRRRRKN
ncbi:LPXTG cell wall anchor domain-containing protein [Sporolactobacillus shoreicorticis]|uniref:SdrD B-like domain-containing protein n=1 Tax=Sporolactobacillus shoreicorticis TaxID=1923877 RepID=A0ABW5S7A3_9BACL|nr:SdrD B-like domain-containing protein [Sporolactobacillus shoreicorticis]MCO7125479.1 LPXTG cell wall anchor domain-containing protein [Sporolactobacillus shoreicorticis]